MGKRKPRKSKRPSTQTKYSLSAKRKQTLKKEAENARRRLRSYLYKVDYSTDIPEPSQYTLENLLKRIESGESYSSIRKELNSLRLDNIREKPSPVTTTTGYRLSSSQVEKIQNQLNKANKNIRNARKKYADFIDILPEEFNQSEIINDIVSKEGFEETLKGLSLYTPKNLAPVSINEDGEAGTYAEYMRYRAILEKENERRRYLAQQLDPRENEGYFVQQSDYDLRQIDIDAIKSMEELRKKAYTWSDPQRIYRANIWLSNYEVMLDRLEAFMINHGVYNSTIEDRIEFIREVIGNMYNNEKAITWASTRMPGMDIGNLYAVIEGDISFDAIYHSWADFSNEYNL